MATYENDRADGDNMNGGEYANNGQRNRLQYEKSPYLLQHADNPVDWYPWGDEAFNKARSEDKPVLLSIGYSTCHWCHVMEHESFEDSEVARVLNEVFVSIKVDREERPDIDQVYMTVCQMITGSGGWPLTIIMTPDREPFFAGTYIPKESRGGRAGLIDLARRVDDLWKNRRGEVSEYIGEIDSALQKITTEAPGDALDEATLGSAFEQLSRRFDERHAGFGSGTKFPTPHNLTFLLRYRHRSGDARALEMVERTLTAMRRGGIFDHVGYGFHRYSTDPEWLVPHFEKMLYDQALLIMAYSEAFAATGKAEYATTAREIAEYVLRDMTSPEGGFYSAEDADSEGVEGKFYVWTDEEIRSVLGEDEADLIIDAFNVEAGGNYHDEAMRSKTGSNILYLNRGPGELASERGIGNDQLEEKIGDALRKLFWARERRVHPLKDDKILTDWNGLMIAALAKASRALGEPAYESAAQRAAGFVLTRMRAEEGKLVHRYRDGEAGLPATLDDYAFLVWGLIELYETTFDADYLKSALELTDDALEHFWDDESGGFFFTADGSEQLLVRSKEIYDGAVPSGNSVFAFNLLRLARITGNAGLESRAVVVEEAFAGQVRKMPWAYTQLLSAADFRIGPSAEVVVVGESRADDTRAMLDALHRKFLPGVVFVFKPSEQESPEIVRMAGYTENQRAVDDRATAYVCRNFHCEQPTTDIDEMFRLLGAD